MGRVNIEIDPVFHKKLKIECAIKEKTIQEYINELLKKVLEKNVK